MNRVLRFLLIPAAWGIALGLTAACVIALAFGVHP